MKKIKILLWDIDGTVLNFLESEKAAIRMGFQKFGLGECSDEMIEEYSAINLSYWKKLERGEITKPELLVRRFCDFFSAHGLDTSAAEEFNEQYQSDLGETICFNDCADELISSFKQNFLQFAVTNGTAVAQHKKLVRSGLTELLDACFISDEIGVEKPNKAFFDRAFAKIKEMNPALTLDCEEVLIIGDSLTSDILGGNNAGIRTCWYNPQGVKADKDVHIDVEIRDLNELKAYLGV